MGMPSYISKVRVESVRVAECSVWTSPDGPGTNMAVEVNVEIGQLLPTPSPADGQVGYVARVGVVAQLVDGDGPAPRARVSVTLEGAVSAPADEENPERAAKVAVAGVLYPQAQAYISMLAAMAQIGGITMPGVDPEALVSAADAIAAGTTD